MSEIYSRSFSALGTICSLHLYGDAELLDQVGASAMMEVDRIERKFSRYRHDSFLSEINRIAATGGVIDLDDETASLIDYAEACYLKSGGLFDITSGLLRQAWDFSRPVLPAAETIGALLLRVGWGKLRWQRPTLSFFVPGMELDLGGIGKEYAVDRLAEICRSGGIRRGLIDLGGDIFVLGPHPNGEPWLITVRHPRDMDEIFGEITVFQGGLATSGDYDRCFIIGDQRYAHILHPGTGWPVQGLASVTVAASHCMVAGSLATIAMLKEGAGPDWLTQMGLPHLWINDNGHSTGNISKRSREVRHQPM